MAVESEDDKIMYAFGAALASQTDQFKKVSQTNTQKTTTHSYVETKRLLLQRNGKSNPRAGECRMSVFLSEHLFFVL